MVSNTKYGIKFPPLQLVTVGRHPIIVVSVVVSGVFGIAGVGVVTGITGVGPTVGVVVIFLCLVTIEKLVFVVKLLLVLVLILFLL